MEIAIRPVAETCALSGRAFAPGDRVWSLLFRNAEGLLDRVDILAEHQDALAPPGPLVCKWSQRIRERAVTEAQSRRAALHSAEEVFIGLYDAEPEGDEARASSDRLKFFLALQLERKRLLKPLGRRRYRHPASGREFSVPDLDITPDLITAFQQEIALMGAK